MSERFHIVSDSAIEDTNRTPDDVWIRIDGNFDIGEKQTYLTWLCKTLNTRPQPAGECAELAEELQRERERCADCVPISWLDSMLTGPDSLLPQDTRGYSCKDFERVLLAIREKILSTEQGGEKDGE